MKKSKKINPTIIFGLLIIVMLCFICGNSMLSGEESSEISNGVTVFVARILGMEVEALSHFVRKCAHFSEFALLGVLVFMFLRTKSLERREFVLSLALCMMAFPLMDETIQLFTPERGPSVSDVWIDMSGYVLGALIVWAISSIVKKRRTK